MCGFRVAVNTHIHIHAHTDLGGGAGVMTQHGPTEAPGDVKRYTRSPAPIG